MNENIITSNIEFISADRIITTTNTLTLQQEYGEVEVLEETESNLEEEEGMNIADEDLLIQLSKSCRCCLGKTEELRPIFENGTRIADMIMLIASIQVIIEIYVRVYT